MTDTIHPDIPHGISDAINDGIARTVAIAGLGAIALIHVLQLPDAFAETAYLGGLFTAAIVAAVVLAAILTRISDERVSSAAGGLAALILLGYVLSRTTGLPDATNDIGEWSEPLGLASLVVESLLVCLAVGALAARRQRESGPATGWRVRQPAGSAAAG
jgi:hypothetical protein